MHLGRVLELQALESLASVKVLEPLEALEPPESSKLASGGWAPPGLRRPRSRAYQL